MAVGRLAGALLAALLLFPAAAAAQDDIVRHVEVLGSTLDATALAQAARPFIGAPLDRAALQHLTDALSALYAASDIGLYTVVVPDQNFAGGDVRIAAYEGFIEQVDLHGAAAGDAALVQAYGRRLAAERPLRKSTLQRYAALLRGIAGLAVDIQIQPGSRPGAARLSLGLARTAPRIAVTLDNQGMPQLGRLQVQAEADFHGVLRDGDTTVLAAAAPVRLSGFQYIALSQSTPLDGDGTAALAATSYLHARPAGAAEEAATLQLGVSHIFVRDFDSALAGSLGIDALDNAVHHVSVENVRALRLALSYVRGEPNQMLSLSAGAGFGVAGLGAKIAGTFPGDRTFRKLTLQAALARRLDDDFILRLHGVAQYAASRLPPSELYLFGGSNIGAAYDPAALFGDSALGGRAELGYRLPSGRELYAFLDGGEAWLRARPGFAAWQGGLASAGGGILLSLGSRGTLDIAAAAAMPARGPDVRLSFALRAETD